jgi:hypothetical protein
MKRCPEVYFISPPAKHRGKILMVMLAKVTGIKIPVELHCSMPDTALISHRELLNTMVSEVYDELARLKSGKKNLAAHPDQQGMPPISAEGQRIFDSPDIQYMSVGADNINPLDPTSKPKTSSIIMP